MLLHITGDRGDDPTRRYPSFALCLRISTGGCPETRPAMTVAQLEH